MFNFQFATGILEIRNLKTFCRIPNKLFKQTSTQILNAGMKMKKSIELKLKNFWIRTDSSGHSLEYPTFTIEVENNSQHSWDGVVIDYCLIGVNGKIISLQETQVISNPVPLNSSRDIEVCIYESGINPLDIAGVNNETSLILRVSGYTRESIILGEIPIPSAPGHIALAQEADEKHPLILLGGTVSRLPSDGADVEINASLAIENKSNRILSRMELKGEIIDKTDKIIDDNFGSSTGTSASSIIHARGFAYIKDKKLKGARLRLSIEADMIYEGSVLDKYAGINVLGAGASNPDSETWNFPG
jgi:hypothetical protein